VDALAPLKSLDWRLRIVGRTDASPTMTADLLGRIDAYALSSRISCLGEVSAEHLAKIFATSDVFVSSSLFEGYGMALAEAMAHGLPIVMAEGGAAADLVPDGAALKIRPGDGAALSAGLGAILSDPDLRRRLAAQALRTGQGLPTWQDTAKIIARTARDLAVAS
jgi:glycosyltransferase involved in cell wall biosynthesis